MFTIHLKAAKDESLVSYLYRFANANGIELLTAWNYIKKDHASRAQRPHLLLLEIDPLKELELSKIRQYIGLSEKDILRMTFFPVLKTFSHSEEVTSSRILRGLLRDVLYYCPLCLVEKVYIRHNWRIGHITCCIKHYVKLLTVCQKCKLPIKLRDMVYQQCCPYCESDLTLMKQEEPLKWDELARNRWFYFAWDKLLSTEQGYISPADCAFRLLYIMNQFNLIFSRSNVSNDYKDKEDQLALL